MTRVVVAPDSFKGSITAADAAIALADGWHTERPGDELLLRPMADGGEGTLDAFAAAVPGARRMPVTVTGPHGRAVDAAWLLLPDGTGVVELASTSGIELLHGDGGAGLRPWDAATTGFGEAIVAALDHGVARLVLGIGSSASTDAGVGMLTALGARFAGHEGAPVAPGLRGVASIADVDLTGLRALPAGGAIVLSDVTNPLCGTRGAAAVFGPQKGLEPADIAPADAALAGFAALIASLGAECAGSSPVRRFDTAPNRRTRREPAHSASQAAALDPQTPGAGAAGGTGFALLAWGAQLAPGAAEVAELVGLRAALADADVVITGEGSYDGQSAGGKVPAFVAALAAESGARAALVAGRITADADASAFTAFVSLTELAGSAAASLADPARWLRAAGAALAASTR